jgi:hypothetical protein
MECQKQQRKNYIVMLGKLYCIEVGYDDRMQYQVECNETYVSEFAM